MTNCSNLSKNDIGIAIEETVKAGKGGVTYLEACIQWLEENSLDVSQYAKYIPEAIVEKLKQEAIASNMLRPSITKAIQPKNNLDFLM